MEPGTRNQELQVALSEFTAAHRGVRQGRLFGASALYAGRRLFASVVDEGLAVRLPTEMARRERQRGARPRGGARDGRAWMCYRVRDLVDARRLWPILEVAARSAADLA